ncbi:MAG: hypothetical protein KDK65_05575, partial [Chlamydiia bacterium]|nr:hypothetical protein [Chlamydiia bacterium]
KLVLAKLYHEGDLRALCYETSEAKREMQQHYVGKFIAAYERVPFVYKSEIDASFSVDDVDAIAAFAAAYDLGAAIPEIDEQVDRMIDALIEVYGDWPSIQQVLFDPEERLVDAMIKEVKRGENITSRELHLVWNGWAKRRLMREFQLTDGQYEQGKATVHALAVKETVEQIGQLTHTMVPALEIDVSLASQELLETIITYNHQLSVKLQEGLLEDAYIDRQEKRGWIAKLEEDNTYLQQVIVHWGDDAWIDPDRQMMTPEQVRDVRQLTAAEKRALGQLDFLVDPEELESLLTQPIASISKEELEKVGDEDVLRAHSDYLIHFLEYYKASSKRDNEAMAHLRLQLFQKEQCIRQAIQNRIKQLHTVQMLQEGIGVKTMKQQVLLGRQLRRQLPLLVSRSVDLDVLCAIPVNDSNRFYLIELWKHVTTQLYEKGLQNVTRMADQDVTADRIHYAELYLQALEGAKTLHSDELDAHTKALIPEEQLPIYRAFIEKNHRFEDVVEQRGLMLLSRGLTALQNGYHASFTLQEKEELLHFFRYASNNHQLNERVGAMLKKPTGAISQDALKMVHEFSFKSKYLKDFVSLADRLQGLWEEQEGKKFTHSELGKLDWLIKLTTHFEKLEEMGLIDSKQLPEFLQQEGVTKEEFAEILAKGRKTREIFNQMTLRLQEEAATRYQTGDVLVEVLDWQAAYKNRALDKEAFAMRYLVTELSHAALIYQPVAAERKDTMLSHVSGDYLEDLISIQEHSYQHVYRFDPVPLILTERVNELKALFGEEWEEQVRQEYIAIQNEIHANKELIDFISNDQKRRYAAGKADFLGGHRTADADHFDSVHRRFFPERKEDYENDQVMICSEFASKVTVATLMEFNKRLMSQAGMESPFIRLPFEAGENLDLMHPGRFVHILSKKGCIRPLPPLPVMQQLMKR